MLSKLSLRNAKRQFDEYALFFVTLTFTVASMYAFNALLFSGTAKSLPDLELLPYLIVTASLLVLLIMGWMISYMIRYMLRRRSRELSIYMVSGLPNRKVRTLLFLENSLMGLLAFLPGLLFGLLLSQILEAVLLHLFGLSYQLHVGFSFPAAGLTFLYFSAMLLYSIRKNGKWIGQVQLRELVAFDRKNERPPVSGTPAAVIIFALSLLSCCLGFLLLCIQPIGKGFDILAGTILLMLFLFGFFLSVPSFLVACFEGRTGWKYKKHRLVTFRGFTAKISSTSTVMGILSVLFMLAITFEGIGATIGLMVTRNVEAGAFDLLLLHKGEGYDFSPLVSRIRQDYPLLGHTYSIYTDDQEDFRAVYEQTVLEAGRTPRRPYAEFLTDTCIKQSDYQRLRALLGYEPAVLDPSLCYVHCIPVLVRPFRELLGQQENLECAGFSFEAEGVFSEPFSQMNDYGNGAGYCLVVPDRAAGQMQVVYSVYAAITKAPLNPNALQTIASGFPGLTRLDRSSAKSSQDGPTALIHDDMAYLSGKWMDKAEFHYLYSILICLFYLALILEITGAAILATQVLSDWQNRQRQDRILRQLGMSEALVARLNNRQLGQLFLLPLLPAMVVSVCFVYVCSRKILVSFFPLPIVPDLLWIAQSLLIGIGLFSLPYTIYYTAARVSYRRR